MARQATKPPCPAIIVEIFFGPVQISPYPFGLGASTAITRISSKYDDIAQRLPVVGGGHRVINLVQWITCRNQFIELEPLWPETDSKSNLETASAGTNE